MTNRLSQGKRFDEIVFPALCAHRGLSGLMPESCLPGFAAGIALGADEIEFDIRLTKDKKLIVSHDDKVDRVANGTGKVSELTLQELQTMQLHSPGDSKIWNVTFSTPEDVFAAIGSATVMNLHFKDFGEDVEWVVAEMKRLVYKYSLQDSVYFSSSEEDTMQQFVAIAPEIPRNALEPWREDLDIVDYAVKYGCSRCQLFKGVFDEDKVKRAIAAGVICNVFWADDEETARLFLDMGISVLLTNRTNLLNGIIDEYRRK
ncbi:MAG: glycerophosphodiester phosphodiesterase family protein [Eubacteriales bacterium]